MDAARQHFFSLRTADSKEQLHPQLGRQYVMKVVPIACLLSEIKFHHGGVRPTAAVSRSL